MVVPWAKVVLFVSFILLLLGTLGVAGVATFPLWLCWGGVTGIALAMFWMIP
jgi:hypothetical protein